MTTSTVSHCISSWYHKNEYFGYATNSSILLEVLVEDNEKSYDYLFYTKGFNV